MRRGCRAESRARAAPGALEAQAGEALGKSDRGDPRVLGPILRRAGCGINHLAVPPMVVRMLRCVNTRVAMSTVIRSRNSATDETASVLSWRVIRNSANMPIQGRS